MLVTCSPSHGTAAETDLAEIQWISKWRVVGMEEQYLVGGVGLGGSYSGKEGPHQVGLLVVNVLVSDKWCVRSCNHVTITIN